MTTHLSHNLCAVRYKTETQKLSAAASHSHRRRPVGSGSSGQTGSFCCLLVLAILALLLLTVLALILFGRVFSFLRTQDCSDGSPCAAEEPAAGGRNLPR
ncbi:MAG: hypothetical protein ACLT3Y_08340 [Ruminococcus callidus]